MRNISSISRTKIGLLGGSFNPPHIGHINISLRVLKKFSLSKVYWLVTPCSPHKNENIYESLKGRLEKCLKITRQFSNRIKVLDIEKNYRTYFSSDTIKKIKSIHNQAEIYWIIGCDNLINIHKWHKWKQICELSHVVVCERSMIALKTHNLKASFNFKVDHIFNQETTTKVDKPISIFHMKKCNISSTELRSMI